MKFLIRRLLGMERLGDVARYKSPKEFIDELQLTHITLLGMLNPENQESQAITEDSILAEIRRNLEHLDEHETFSPLIMNEGGERKMGVFTTDSDLHAFTREYVRGPGRGFVFQTFATTGKSLPYFMTLIDRFVLNPASKDSFSFKDEHMDILREIRTAEQAVAHRPA